jgi:uncharacterized protein with HEPN domain
MTSSRGDAARIADILRAISRVEEILHGGYESFASSWIIQSAVTRELEVIGEAAGAVSTLTRGEHPEVEWNQMRGFSSFAKHEYWRVDPKRLWAAVTEMPSLRKKVGRVMPPVE